MNDNLLNATNFEYSVLTHGDRQAGVGLVCDPDTGNFTYNAGLAGVPGVAVVTSRLSGMTKR